MPVGVFLKTKYTIIIIRFVFNYVTCSEEKATVLESLIWKTTILQYDSMQFLFCYNEYIL